MNINIIFSALINHINTSMKDPLFSPANIIAIIATAISLISLCLNMILLVKLNKLSKRQFTLSYIESENNNTELQDAKKYLYNNEYNTKAIRDCAYKGIRSINITLTNNINTIIRSLLSLYDCIVGNILDEKLYMSIRYIDIRDYYYFLSPYIEEMPKVVNGINNKIRKLREDVENNPHSEGIDYKKEEIKKMEEISIEIQQTFDTLQKIKNKWNLKTQ